ncbi:MAG: 30S ribosomal protein S12 methylthiotransferase RimO [Clostridiaceae bacterium]|nr:30S ribosomal protein S12 methylthiotransferase RimO [Clostridiaceae bacterium]
MKQKIGLISLGCPKNLVDSEIMMGTLKEAGYELTTKLEMTDIIIVNTCAFIGDAKEEAIMSIFEASMYKTHGNLKTLIVTGCLAERYKDEIIKEIPEVDLVIGTGSIGRIVEIIEENHINNLQKVYADLPDSVDYLDNSRVLSDNKPYVYLKIAEGCSNHCTYCIIPNLRGRFRSRTIESIVNEAEELALQGKKEIVLVAQDVTRYGLDLYGEIKLVTLIRRLSSIEGIARIRLLYCYPELINDELIEEMRTNPKLCKYFDIPLQHISNKILKTMGRRGTKEYIIKLLKTLRERIPGLVIRTTFIVGFPGETEEDYNELYSFIKDNQFEHLGVFSYSKEEGTPAYKFKDHLPEAIKKERRDKIMELQYGKIEQYNCSLIGRIYDTIIEGVAEDGIFYIGRSYAEAPEIDPVIYLTSAEPLEIGDIVPVKILCADGYDLIGEVQI